MLIPRHWIRETMKDASGATRHVLGWSDISEDDAREHARSRWKQILARVAGREARAEDYSVAVCEPIVREIDAGPLRAVITRNRYGAQVLNCDRLCFIDIDKPKGGAGPGLLASLWNKLRGKNPEPAVNPETALLERVRAVATASGLTIRVYRTHSGWRLAILNRTYEPASRDAEELFRKFPQSDWLYRELCRKQDCFRARLTPKPWRIKATGFPDKKYPRGFPWPDHAAAQAASDWVARYEAASAGHRTCAHLGDFGRNEPLPEILSILNVHDSLCGVSLDAAKLV